MSQIMRPTFVSPSRHGISWYVSGSGIATMSDSSIALKPVIDEPSKPMPSSSASPISLGVTAKLFRCPSMSVNQRRMNSIPSSSMRPSTSLRTCGSLVARLPVPTCAIDPPSLVISRPSIPWMRAGERAELEAMRDWVAASPGGPIEFAQCGSAVALRSSAYPVRELNRIVGLYDLKALDELVLLYEADSFWIALDPEAGLDAELQALGYVPDYAWQKFERGLEPVDARTDLRVVHAESPADFGTAFARGYGLPPALGDFGATVVGRPRW